jgi:aspartyl protease family protein
MASRWRFFLWLALLVAGGLGMWKLSVLFPAPADSGWDQAYLVRWIAILVFISGGAVFAREIRVSELLRNAALWSAVLAVLVLGYTYRVELQDIGLRVRSELVPGYPIATDPRTLILSAAEDGGYHVVGLVNGTPIEFLIDTGASDIVLSPADATRIGMDKKNLDFSHVFETAHGLGRGASSHVASLSIGPIALSDVAVSINQSEMRNSLLGMAFLNRLDSFEVERSRLVLRWRK